MYIRVGSLQSAGGTPLALLQEEQQHGEYEFEDEMRRGAIAEILDWGRARDEEADRVEDVAAVDNGVARGRGRRGGRGRGRGRRGAAAGAALVAAPAAFAEDNGLADLHDLAGDDDIDFLAYRRFLSKTGKYTDVVDERGRLVGQIQTMGGYMSPYKAVAVCSNSSHQGRCARQRAWKMQTEHPEFVELVLARWLLRGSLHASTHSHMEREPRF